ncbi:MAG: hypothetical protein C6I00_05230 [Nitratiruptor sp.]|nr:hypothetical protein [Nitratiruptor sp.]NPA83501.1 hypothetical protein [Campylobacterota bacterium]
MVADFFKEELVFILIALFLFGIGVYVATREFVPLNPKRFLPLFALFLTGLLIFHYTWRKEHMAKVAKAFHEGKRIECLDKTSKVGGIVIHKGAWSLEGDTFVNPNFYRTYNIRQCIVGE